MGDKLYTIMIEVIEVDYDIFNECGIEVLANKVSLNDWLDLTIRGTRKKLLYFLETYHGESTSYFNTNQVR
jgi:hypothetical protein